MQENCPCCPNHCSKDSLRCNRGREYFNSSKSYKIHNNDEPTTLNEQVIKDLRVCGHILHHSEYLDANKMLSNISDEELKELHRLLTKIHSNME